MLGKLKRNDVQAALEAYKSGASSRDDIDMLLSLQDDPSTLAIEIGKLRKPRTDYDDDQPRDENGRWASTGATAVARDLISQSGGSTRAALKLFDGNEPSELYGDGGAVSSRDVKLALEQFLPKEHDESDLVTIHHSTSREVADILTSEGFIPEAKPTNLARERYERGEETAFAPGKGLSKGLYVGAAGTTSGYGQETLEIQVPRSWLEIPPELHGIESDIQKALHTEHGAVVGRAIHPKYIKRVRRDYDEDQPRDEGGRWTSGGGGGGGATRDGRSPSKREKRSVGTDTLFAARERARELEDKAFEAENRNSAEAMKAWEEASKANREYLEIKRKYEGKGPDPREKIGEEIRKAREGYAPPAMGSAGSDPEAKKEYFRTNADPENVERLAGMRIVSAKPLGGGVNVTQLVTLNDGTKAVWKPAQGEDKDLRSNIPNGTQYLREAAAARVAKIVGVEDLVPAVVVHHGDTVMGPFDMINKQDDGALGAMDYGVKGSLHAYAPGTPLGKFGLYGLTYSETRETLQFDRDASERMRVFDYITGNSDRHQNNVLVHERDGKYMPVLIDNGLSFPLGAPDRFIQPEPAVHRGPLLDSTVEMIKSISLGDLAKTLKEGGIEKEAAEHALLRAARLQADPDILSSYKSDGDSRRADEFDDVGRQTPDKVLWEGKQLAYTYLKRHYGDDTPGTPPRQQDDLPEDRTKR